MFSKWEPRGVERLTANPHTNGLTTKYSYMEDSESGVGLHIYDDCVPPETALAIAEAFTRLAQELPEAPTDD